MDSLDGGAPDSFPVLLRRHRLERQLTQEELAHHAGVSVRAVRNAELGRVRCPQADSVRRLADALGLSPQARQRFAEAARARRAPAPPLESRATPAEQADTETVRLPAFDVVRLVLRPTGHDHTTVVEIAASRDGADLPAMTVSLSVVSPPGVGGFGEQAGGDVRSWANGG
jgi:transcriptional regulator with XRE-family HTH domain